MSQYNFEYSATQYITQSYDSSPTIRSTSPSTSSPKYDYDMSQDNDYCLVSPLYDNFNVYFSVLFSFS